VAEVSKHVDLLLAPEMNLGQLRFEIERAARGRCEVVGVNLVGGEVLKPQDILAAISEAARPSVPA
jgi:2-oxoglutarate ferredoxin oxidoreductase subunit alpha